MRRLTILTSLLLLAVSLARAQEELGYLCNSQLPIEVPPGSPLVFQDLQFESGLDGSDGGVTLVNRSDKDIQYYVAILEFLDEKGNYLISVPVYNVQKDQSIPLDVPFKTWLLRNWPGGHMAPISARASSRETFGNVLAMLSCPTSARVDMVRIRFDDDTEFKYTSLSLQIPAAPSQRMRMLDVETPQRWLPITISGSLGIDAEGNVQILELDSAPIQIASWIKKEVANWKFTPAWANGKPVSVQLPFVFFLGETTHNFARVELMRKKGARGAMLIWPNFN